MIVLGARRHEVQEILALSRERGLTVKFADTAVRGARYRDLLGPEQFIEAPVEAREARGVADAVESVSRAAARAPGPVAVWPAPGFQELGGAVVDHLRGLSRGRGVLGNSSRAVEAVADPLQMLRALSPVRELSMTFRDHLLREADVARAYDEVNGMVTLHSRRGSEPGIDARDGLEAVAAWRTLRGRGVPAGEIYLVRSGRDDGPQVDLYLGVQTIGGKLQVASLSHGDVSDDRSAAVSPSQMPSSAAREFPPFPEQTEAQREEFARQNLEQKAHIDKLVAVGLAALEAAGIWSGTYRVNISVTGLGPKPSGLAVDEGRRDPGFRRRDEVPSVSDEILSLFGVAPAKASKRDSVVGLWSLVAPSAGFVESIAGLERLVADGTARLLKRAGDAVQPSDVVATLRVEAPDVEAASRRMDAVGPVALTIRPPGGKEPVVTQERPFLPIFHLDAFKLRYEASLQLAREVYPILEKMEWWRSLGFVVVQAMMIYGMLALGGPTLQTNFYWAYSFLGCSIGALLSGPVLSLVRIQTLLWLSSAGRAACWSVMAVVAFCLPGLIEPPVAWYGYLYNPILVLAFLDGLIVTPGAMISYNQALWVQSSIQFHLPLDEADQSAPNVRLQATQAIGQVFGRWFLSLPLVLLVKGYPQLNAVLGPLITLGIAAAFVITTWMMYVRSRDLRVKPDMGNREPLGRRLNAAVHGAVATWRSKILKVRVFANIAYKNVQVALIVVLVPTIAYAAAASLHPGHAMLWCSVFGGAIGGVGFLGAMIMSLGIQPLPPPGQSWRDRRFWAYQLCAFCQKLAPSSIVGWRGPTGAVPEERLWDDYYKPFFSFAFQAVTWMGFLPAALGLIAFGHPVLGLLAAAAGCFMYFYYGTATDLGLNNLMLRALRTQSTDENGRDASASVTIFHSALLMFQLPLVSFLLYGILYGKPFQAPEDQETLLGHLTPENFLPVLAWFAGVYAVALIIGAFERYVAPYWMGLKARRGQARASGNGRPPEPPVWVPLDSRQRS
ncbi:MAG: hypothetical protein HY552_04225 [Elusimicrobia bacterium]|nr:hypothetical protein [Elusimicrobiota bacterium]